MSPPHTISPFKRFFKSVFFIGVAVIPMNSPLSFSITLKNLVILSLSIKVLTNLYLLFSFVINNGFSKVGLIKFKYSNLLSEFLSAKWFKSLSIDILLSKIGVFITFEKSFAKFNKSALGCNCIAISLFKDIFFTKSLILSSLAINPSPSLFTSSLAILSLALLTSHSPLSGSRSRVYPSFSNLLFNSGVISLSSINLNCVWLLPISFKISSWFFGVLALLLFVVFSSHSLRPSSTLFCLLLATLLSRYLLATLISSAV